MYKLRKLEGEQDWLDADGVKIYTISANEEPICSGLIVPDTSISFSYYVTRGEYG